MRLPCYTRPQKLFTGSKKKKSIATSLKSAFLIALCIHVIVFLLLLAGSYRSSEEAKVPVHSFELVPAEQFLLAKPVKQPLKPWNSEIPSVEQKESITPKVVSSVAEAAKPISKEAFDQMHPKTASKTRPIFPQTSKVEFQAIDSKDLQQALEKPLPSVTVPSIEAIEATLPATSQNVEAEVLAYQQSIKPKIEAAWRRPYDSAEGLRAVVQFDVLPNGSVVNIRIVKASGNKRFDGSIWEAFRNMGALGKVPDGSILRALQLTFELVQ